MLRASRTYVAWAVALAVGVVGSAVLLTPVSSADEPEFGTSSISGTVTWPRGEEPVPEMTLYRWAESQGALRWVIVADTTDVNSNGAYKFSDLPAGRYLVETRDLKEDLAPTFHGGPLMHTAARIEVADAQAVTGIGVALELGGSIAGTLTVPEDVEVVSLNVNIFLSDNDGAGPVWRPVGRAAAETDGHYQARSLRTGTYRLEFVDDMGAVQSEFYDDAATIDQAADVVVGRGEAVFDIDADLSSGGTITGQIQAPVPTEALGKVRVTVYEFGADGSDQWEKVNEGLTNPEGRYTISGLSAGTYRVGFRDVENEILLPEFHQDAASVEQGKDVVLGHREVVTVDAVLGVGATLEGTVSSPEGLSVHELEVSLHRREGAGSTAKWRVLGEPVLTDIGGGYRFTQLPPGTYRVEFNDPTEKFVPEFWDNAATIGAARDVTLTSGATMRGVDAVLSTGASLSGTVTAGTLPVAGVRVKAYTAVGGEWRESATTAVDATGRWELAGLKPGAYRLGFSDATGRLRAEFHDDVATLAAAKEIVLTARGRITGISTALAGTPTVTPTPTPTAVPTPTVTPTPTPVPTTPTTPTTGPTTSPAPTTTPTPTAEPRPTPQPKKIKWVKAPKVTGKAKVGKALQVSKGTWKPKSVKVKYQWFTKKGKKLVKVKAGKKSKLALKRSMRGKKYRVVVTVSRKGYRTVKFTSKWSRKVKK